MDVCIVAMVILVVLIILKLIEISFRRSYIDDITKDKYVLITGCDTGFGNELAKQLDLKGVNVIATCLTEKGRRDIEQTSSGRVMTLLLDVTKHESIINAYGRVKSIIPNQSALWGVVNNAGISVTPGQVEWSKRDDYEKTMAVNFFGAVDVTLTFLPLLKKSGGRLVNVTSSAGRLAAVTGGYSESKFALEAFSDIIRRGRKLFGYQYRISIIEPGFFATKLTSRDCITQSVEGAWNRLSKEEKEDFPERIMHECVEGKVNAMNYLASSDTSQVTNAMEHALFAKWPKSRYSVGWDAKLLWIPLSYMPSCIADTLLKW
ncbi:retinol dehydrogenase 16-like [Lytechinus pictus]|uniref:retinol dehydrogenase 16-like n=1 Tax=Lytechinus pictus TaxID=7653 RepID=UPI0030B9EA42